MQMSATDYIRWQIYLEHEGTLAQRIDAGFARLSALLVSIFRGKKSGKLPTWLDFMPDYWQERRVQVSDPLVQMRAMIDATRQMGGTVPEYIVERSR